ncbi:hypothetical protein [Nocardia cyriacigeorgica]|uniref:hypothetical protein n=1 Tax=Nocardia cyriacigeorgica TaxID=135487 RepID=UPI0013D85EA3|nr:hypothetical protein [Nocardia cyriacigeorgica]NEW27318.1 hypothetical protein [Nocardia cyriacigeorgica]
MNEIEYAFGTGDGAVDVWSTQANLELAGSPDAVQLDFDGDGLIDDAMWDTQGDGVADVAALDLNDDGVLDAFFTDPSGTGVWDHQITGTSADAASEPLDWIVRGDAPPAPAGHDSPAGYAATHPGPAEDPRAGQAAPESVSGQHAPPHPAPSMGPSGGHGDQPPLASRPGPMPAPPQPIPPVDPFGRPDMQPGNPAGLVVQFDLEMQVHALPGQQELSVDPAVAGSTADERG